MAYKPPPKKEKKKDPALSNAMAADMVAVGGAESVNVCVRCRPFNRRELELHAKNNPDEFIRSVVEMPDGCAGNLRMMERDPKTGEYSELEMFHFSRTFWSIPDEQQPHKYLPIQQEDVFECVGKVVLTNALGGFNSCIFAYGQTGSGKTHSMMGDFQTKDGDFSGDPGLIPRMCRELFSLIDAKKAELEAADPRLKVEFDVKLSAIEIYNEQVKDLFWKSTQGRKKDTVLKIRVHPVDGAFVDQLTWLNPKHWEQCIKLIANGVGERTVAATLMNPESSRSHSVFQIIVQRTESLGPPPDDPSRRFEKPVVTTKSSRINLVDLAGSERNKKSGAQGQQLKEAAGINQSMSTLKKVIDTLVDNSKISNPKKQQIVPYRESALTQLLSHSLGGNSKTTMIACVSPHYDNAEETVLTLRYAARAKGIINQVKANEDNAAKQAMLLREQIMALQAKLAEGANENDGASMDELKDQLAVGQRALAEMHERQREKEREAERAAAQLKSQKDARYAAMYYNAFKRCLLQRQRDLSEAQLYMLEQKLKAAANEKEAIANSIAERERVNRESKYTVEELKRRDELWSLKSARNEASARQLVRDIAKSRKRVEDNLAARFGLSWVCNREARVARQTLAEAKTAMQKDHEQYLQSIVREAKKQYDALCLKYADREETMRERLETVERGRNHAAAQLEKAEQLELQLEGTLSRAENEHFRRENEKQSQWEKRYKQMQELYEEKIREIKKRSVDSRDHSKTQIDDARRRAEIQKIVRQEDVEQQLKQADIDGAARVQEVIDEATQRIDEMVKKSNDESTSTQEALRRQFEADKATLEQQIATVAKQANDSHRKLEELYRYALQLDDDAKHVSSALQRPQPKNPPTDYMLFRREMEQFVRLYGNQHIEFHRISNLLRKPMS